MTVVNCIDSVDLSLAVMLGGDVGMRRAGTEILYHGWQIFTSQTAAA